jgi:hypothetical protein
MPVQPHQPDPDHERAWLLRQRARDLETIDAQADLIAGLEAEKVVWVREKAILILQAKRDR